MSSISTQFVYVDLSFILGQGSKSSSPSPPGGTTIPLVPVAVGVAIGAVLVVVAVVVVVCCRRCLNNRKPLDTSRALICLYWFRLSVLSCQFICLFMYSLAQCRPI